MGIMAVMVIMAVMAVMVVMVIMAVMAVIRHGVPCYTERQSMKRGDALLGLIGNTPLIPLFFEAEE